jgi:hypothetical protein
MKDRAQRHVADAERDHGGRMPVHDRLHVRSRLVDRAMNKALGEQPRVGRLDRLGIDVNSRTSLVVISAGASERDIR